MAENFWLAVTLFVMLSGLSGCVIVEKKCDEPRPHRGQPRDGCSAPSAKGTAGCYDQP